MSEHTEETTVQLDSVIGKVGGKCLLTIHFVESSFMLAFLRDANTSGSVIRIINAIDKVIGADKFNQLFPVILTDNGSEFSNPKEIEYRSNFPLHRTNVFYCDPSAPYQKGKVVYKTGIPLTKVDFCLQIGLPEIQTGLSDYYLPW